MLSGMQSVAEIGCGDGFASRMIAETCEKSDLSDFDGVLLSYAKSEWLGFVNNVEFLEHDIIANPLPMRNYDVIYSLDVLEHIDREKEDNFFESNQVLERDRKRWSPCDRSPWLSSKRFASPRSREVHVNCKTGSQLVETCKSYFNSACRFSMNDEVVHTGFSGMAHYYFVIYLNPKN